MTEAKQQCENMEARIQNSALRRHSYHKNGTCSADYRVAARDTDECGENNDDRRGQNSLITGLPDEVVLDCILAKLSWRQLPSLGRVNHTWYSAIQGLELYNARVRTGTSQKLIAILHKRSSSEKCTIVHNHDGKCGERHSPESVGYALSLFDPADNSWKRLPPIPGVGCGIPLFSELVCLKGKLFVVGGRDQDTWETRREVYMLDLVAGKGTWQQCASMLSSRASFACAVLDEKVFVAGGDSNKHCTLAEAEMFDPELNIWHPLANMNGPRSCCTAAVVGGNLYVIGGFTWLGLAVHSDQTQSVADAGWEDPAEVYDVTTKTWKLLGTKRNDYDEQACTVVDGKLYSFSTAGVVKYDSSSNLWESLKRKTWFVQGHTISPALILTMASVETEILAVVCLGDERDRGCTLLRTSGFSDSSSKLIWDKVSCPSNTIGTFSAMCSMEL